MDKNATYDLTFMWPHSWPFYKAKAKKESYSWRHFPSIIFTSPTTSREHRANMETSSLIQRTSKISKSKMKNYHHSPRNPCLKNKRSIIKNNNHHTQNDEHHNHHHNLATHYRNRHISPRITFLKHNRNHSKVNGIAKVDGCSRGNGNFNCVKLGGSVNKFGVKSATNNFDESTNELITEASAADAKGLIGEDKNGEDNDLAASKAELVVGNFTREVYNAICLRLGDTLHIPEDSVKALFNDMHLFPSDTQVTKMLQCARQYSRRNGPNPNYLTFGEFCFFVREMQNHPSPKAHRKLQQKGNNNKCLNNKCEVFLGGSCNPTTWRADTAIPELQKHGISFYNPQVSKWAPELLAQEHDAKQSASVLLFVIDSQTRSTVGMLEVAYLVASGRCVIVVAQPYRMGQTIMGETITDREYYDLVQGQKSLLDLIKSKGVQIHTSLATALQCTADILRNVSVNGTSPEEQVTYKLKRLRDVYESYNGQMRIYDVIEAYRRLTNRSLEISKLYNYFNLQNGNGTVGTTTTNGSDGATLSFEKFCTVMAELSTDGCGMCNIEAWASQTFMQNLHTQCPNTPSLSKCAVDPSQVSASLSVNRQHLYDVYLGGSLSTGTNWREQIAIPLLKQNGLQYYNPAIRDSTSTSHEDSRSETWQDDVSRWRHEVDQCKVALFVITNDTRSLTSMILAAHYIGSGRDVVLSMEQLNSESCVVAQETLTKIAIKDYNRARTYLRDLAERRQVPVLDNVEQAITCVISKLSKSTMAEDSNSRTELNR